MRFRINLSTNLVRSTWSRAGSPCFLQFLSLHRVCTVAWKAYRIRNKEELLHVVSTKLDRMLFQSVVYRDPISLHTTQWCDYSNTEAHLYNILIIRSHCSLSVSISIHQVFGKLLQHCWKKLKLSRLPSLAPPSSIAYSATQEMSRPVTQKQWSSGRASGGFFTSSNPRKYMHNYA